MEKRYVMDWSGLNHRKESEAGTKEAELGREAENWENRARETENRENRARDWYFDTEWQLYSL